jgi:hypothetical protein
MLKWVLKKWEADLDSTDEADALSCAHIARGLLDYPDALTRLGYENDVLKAMHKSEAAIWAELTPEERYELGAPAAWARANGW